MIPFSRSPGNRFYSTIGVLPFSTKRGRTARCICVASRSCFNVPFHHASVSFLPAVSFNKHLSVVSRSSEEKRRCGGRRLPIETEPRSHGIRRPPPSSFLFTRVSVIESFNPCVVKYVYVFYTLYTHIARVCNCGARNRSRCRNNKGAPRVAARNRNDVVSAEINGTLEKTASTGISFGRRAYVLIIHPMRAYERNY